MSTVACSNYWGAAASYESPGACAGVCWCVLVCAGVCGTPCAGMPCERFAAGPGLPPCKVNELRWCQTDLAANAYAWPRFIADDMRFAVLDSGHGANHDGFMADVVRARQWKVGVPLHRTRLGVSNSVCRYGYCRQSLWLELPSRNVSDAEAPCAGPVL